MAVEIRYVGSKGHELLEARAFNQGYDLNDPSTPDYIFERFNQAYVAAGSPERRAQRRSAPHARAGVGRAFGFTNATLGGMLDYNLANCRRRRHRFRGAGPDSRLQHSRGGAARQHGRSLYHSLQINFLRRMSQGCSSTCPTPTRARRTRARSIRAAPPAAASRTCQTSASRCRATSATWTRTTRCRTSTGRTVSARASSTSCPGFARGFRVSGFVQLQSGLPYSIYAAEPESQTAAQYTDLVRGSGGLYRAAFGRPSLCGSLDDLRQPGVRSDRGRVQRVGALLAAAPPPVAIRTTSASATSGAMCCAGSGSAASI